MVDDFVVKYVGKEHARYLISVLKEHYEISEYWEGKKYVGLTFDWDYKKKWVHVSMPGYVHHSLILFEHGTPLRYQDDTYQHTVQTYGDRQRWHSVTRQIK